MHHVQDKYHMMVMYWWHLQTSIIKTNNNYNNYNTTNNFDKFEIITYSINYILLCFNWNGEWADWYDILCKKQNQNIKNIFEMIIQILVSAESNYNKIIICGNIINKNID